MINFCCVSYGTKYKPEYVQKLYNMVERHLTLPYKFICFTDQDQLLKRQVKGDIEFRRFKDHTLHGYWNKLQLFNEEENLEGAAITNLLDDVHEHFEVATRLNFKKSKGHYRALLSRLIKTYGH